MPKLSGLMNIRNKLFLLLLGAGLTGTGITAYFSYQTAKDALEKQVFSHLVSVRDVKRRQIESYFKEQLSHIEIHGIDPFFAQYLMDRKYLVSNNANLKILTVDEDFRKKFQIEMGTSIEKHGFYDIFLIDLKGNVLQSIKKEDDLGTNLITGKYKTTSLARAFNAGLKGPVYSDVEFYEPSQGEACAFFAAPVRYEESGEVLGVMAAQVDMREINAIMQERSGLGETGETFLLGMNMLLRSDSRFFKKHTALKLKVDREAYRRFHTGETGSHEMLDYRNVPVLMAYTAVDIPGLNWAIIAKMDRVEAFAEISNLKWKILYGSLILLLSILFVCYFVANKFTAPIKVLKERLSDMSSFMEGNQSIPVTSSDEIGSLVDSFNKMGFKINFQTNEIEKTNKDLQEELEERKKAEKTLKEEKNKMSAIIEAIEHGMTIQNLDYDIIYQNKQLSDTFGNMGEKCYKVYEGKDSVCDGCPVEMAFKDGKPHTSERKIVMPSGEINFWENTANPIRDASGNIISCLEITRNITHRKQEEEALAESEEKYREVVETTNDLITQVDSEGKLLFVNHMAEKFFGISPEHCIGRSAFDFIHLNDREDTQKKFKDWVTQKITSTTYENRQVNKQGQIFNMLWAINFRYDAKKNLIGLNSIARDITERKKMEDQIKASLQEKEILLREIHHRVKNNMQIVSSLLMLQSEYLNDEKDIELFRESQNRIKSMAIIHENLYQSENLAKIDFKVYVKNLTDGLLRSYKINGNNIAIKIDIKDVSLVIETAIPCSLIINELISNSIKYAFPDGEKGEIKISMSKKKDGEIEMIVADNGVSIPKDLDFRHTKTLGLQLITGLAEKQLDGKIELNISKGTEFRVRFKELQNKKRI